MSAEQNRGFPGGCEHGGHHSQRRRRYQRVRRQVGCTPNYPPNPRFPPAVFCTLHPPRLTFINYAQILLCGSYFKAVYGTRSTVYESVA